MVGLLYLERCLLQTPLGSVVYFDLLAPDVLLYDLCVLDHVLADPNLLLGHRTLLYNHLFLGERDADLVLADLCLGGLTLDRHPLHGDLLVAGGDLYLLAVGTNALSHDECASFALTGSCPKLLLGALNP